MTICLQIQLEAQCFQICMKNTSFPISHITKEVKCAAFHLNDFEMFVNSNLTRSATRKL